MATTPELLKTAELLEVIEFARNAEICRNISQLQKILHPLIDENDPLTSFDSLENPIRAELLRLYGFFLTFEGRAKAKRDFHLTAKDFVTKAIGIFENENLPEKTAEAEITLAFCYWNNGESEEAEAFFELLEAKFVNKLDPVFLQLQINKIMLYWCSGRFDQGIKIINEISTIVEFCADFRLRIMFNLESANLYQFRDKKISENYYEKVIALCKQHKHDYFLAVAYNNYSFVLSDKGNFAKAHDLIRLSEKGFRRLDQNGWLPHIADSKAQIFLTEKRYLDALKSVDDAIRKFAASDDHYGFVGALWTKCRILLNLQRISEAFQVFGELQIHALQNIGRKTFDYYAELLNVNQ
ncbi:MAG: hypothetical protein LUM44_10030 [Pyrinomonadaceae bacterium]|nr:hypothetical protein [Pyrinomonadaceae bacterium]